MESPELIEEIQRLQAEHGACKVMLVDEMEPDWKYPVTDIDFDADNQAIIVSASR